MLNAAAVASIDNAYAADVAAMISSARGSSFMRSQAAATHSQHGVFCSESS